MKEITVEIKNEAGLHARPSSKFVEIATKYSSSIDVVCDAEVIDGKTIMGLMLLGAEKGKRLLLRADGIDEEEMLGKLRYLIEVEKFYED